MSQVWRSNGVSYLQFVNFASKVLRGAVKEPLRSKLAARNLIDVRHGTWTNGVQTSRVPVTEYNPPRRAEHGSTGGDGAGAAH